MRLARGLRLTPLEMSDAVPAQAISIRSIIRRNGTPFRFDAFSEQEPGRLALVGMTPLGTRGFSAVWEGGRFDYDHLPFYKLPIPAQELILAYQLIYLPASVLTAQLQKHGVSLEEGTGLRRFQYRGRALVVVHYKNEEIRFEGQGYTLLVKTHEVEDLDL